MSGEDEAATYAEINDVSGKAFQMDVNKCYSNVTNTLSKSKSDGKENSLKQVRYFIILILVVILVLAATSVCVIFALVEISKLKSRVGDGLSTLQHSQNSCCIKSDVDIASLQEQLSMFQQNVSEADESIVTSLSHNSEQLSELRQNLSQLQLRVNLIFSCAALSPSSPSGYYWVRASNGSVVRVYCDMTLSCGGVTGGWMRVAELNMTDTSQQCPSNLVERSDNNIWRCETMNAGCFPTTYSTLNINYRKVCGRITGYQVGSTNAFRRYYYQGSTINSNYVDGVSLTHGNPRQHIWTFAAAIDRNDDYMIGGRISRCPCRFEENPFDPLPFVGEDYFCDAGNEVFITGETGLQTDPLWDGTDCLCCDNPPWFYKQLPQSTTDDIEMRVCRNEGGGNENIGIQEIELYIQ